ncbi:hypothetical protein PR202_gb29368 [Eleusine coracana subsp. coracana]|uniref:Retrotransposon gag domain-containing protein n=1 Tax=Eleusine coracana subsp. coracana TaxID=191504 RepID=A0AAV5FZ60_ELECO|nr:hypothetical protein PR202_gb29368 [Eleusine coracana subsp. coracana]
MIEAQDDFYAFKAAHLPVEGNWDEITLEYGEQEDDDPESSQQGASAQPSLAEILATVINRQQNEAELLRQLVENTSNLGGRGGNRNNNQPPALMQRKLQEFTDLKQGGRNVLQYSEVFNHLAQYANEYVNTEEKKRYAFLRGMNAKLKERLTWQQTGTYNDLVNAAIVQEGAMRQVEEEDRKRKAPASASETAPAKHRLVFTSPTGQRYRTPPAATIPAPVYTELPKATTAAEPSFPCAVPAGNSIVHRISSKGTQILVPHSLLTVEATIHVTTVVALATLLRIAPHLDATTTSTSVQTRAKMGMHRLVVPK